MIRKGLTQQRRHGRKSRPRLGPRIEKINGGSSNGSAVVVALASSVSLAYSSDNINSVCKLKLT